MFVIMSSRFTDGIKTEAFLIAARNNLVDARNLLTEVVADFLLLSSETLINKSLNEVEIHDSRWDRVIRVYEIVEVCDDI